MEYRTERLLLRTVTEEDLEEVARTWPSDHRPVSEEEARAAIDRMQQRHAQNRTGSLAHLCLAVCRTDEPLTVMGWCGLEPCGARNLHPARRRIPGAGIRDGMRPGAAQDRGREVLAARRPRRMREGEHRVRAGDGEGRHDAVRGRRERRPAVPVSGVRENSI